MRIKPFRFEPFQAVARLPATNCHGDIIKQKAARRGGYLKNQKSNLSSTLVPFPADRRIDNGTCGRVR
jgi:hypothetical protein